MSQPPETASQSLAETGNQVNQAYEQHIKRLGLLTLPVAWFLVPASSAVSPKLSSETNLWITRRAWVRTLAVGAATIAGTIFESQLPPAVPVGIALYEVLSLADALYSDSLRMGFQQQ